MEKEFNVKALESLVSDAGSARKLEHAMYNAMGDSGWLSQSIIRRYVREVAVPGPEAVTKFKAYAEHLGLGLEFYKPNGTVDSH